jgi:hypothetical protein
VDATLDQGDTNAGFVKDAKMATKPRLSDHQKEALKKLDKKQYRSASEVGLDEKLLVALVVKRVATMTKASGRMYFLRKG